MSVQTTRESFLQAFRKRFFSTVEGPKELNIMNDKHYMTSTTIVARYKNHFFPRQPKQEKGQSLAAGKAHQNSQRSSTREFGEGFHFGWQPE